MNETMKILFGLFGGLAVFIFGMNMMSEKWSRRHDKEIQTME